MYCLVPIGGGQGSRQAVCGLDGPILDGRSCACHLVLNDARLLSDLLGSRFAMVGNAIDIVVYHFA